MKRPPASTQATSQRESTSTSDTRSVPEHGATTLRRTRRTPSAGAKSSAELLNLLKLIVINLDVRRPSAGAAIANFTARRADRSAHFFKNINGPLADVMLSEQASSDSGKISRIKELATAPWPTSQCGPIRELIGRLLDCIAGSIESIKAGHGNQFESQTGSKVTALEVGSWLLDLRGLLTEFSDGLDRAIPFDAEVPAKIGAVAGRLREAIHFLELAGEGEFSEPRRKSADRKKRQMDWLAKAMLTVRDRPDWKDAQIARHLGIDRSRLSRSKEYKLAAKIARAMEPTKGFITTSRGTKQLEAQDDSFDPNRPASLQSEREKDLDDRLDREINERNAQRNKYRGNAP